MSLLVIDPYRFAVAGDTFIMGYRQDVMGWSSVDGSSGMTYTRTQHSSYLGGGEASQASDAEADDGDWMEWTVNLAAGTYTITVLHSKYLNGAICDVSLDGTSVGTYDRYAAGVSYNNVSEFTGITVAADGNYKVRITANGKHASSSDYRVNAQSVTMTRTGA